MSYLNPVPVDYAAAVWSSASRTLGSDAVPAAADPVVAAIAAAVWAAAGRTLTTPAYSVVPAAPSAVVGRPLSVAVARGNGRAFAAADRVVLTVGDGTVLTVVPYAGQVAAAVTYTPAAVPAAGAVTVTPSNNFGGVDAAPFTVAVAGADLVAVADDGTFDSGPVPVGTAAAYQRVLRVPTRGRWVEATVQVGPAAAVARLRVLRGSVPDDATPVTVGSEAAVPLVPAATFPLAAGSAYDLADQAYAEEWAVEAGGAAAAGGWVRVYGRAFYPGGTAS